MQHPDHPDIEFKPSLAVYDKDQTYDLCHMATSLFWIELIDRGEEDYFPFNELQAINSFFGGVPCLFDRHDYTLHPFAKEYSKKLYDKFSKYNNTSQIVNYNLNGLWSRNLTEIDYGSYELNQSAFSDYWISYTEIQESNPEYFSYYTITLNIPAHDYDIYIFYYGGREFSQDWNYQGYACFDKSVFKILKSEESKEITIRFEGVPQVCSVIPYRINEDGSFTELGNIKAIFNQNSKGWLYDNLDDLLDLIDTEIQANYKYLDKGLKAESTISVNDALTFADNEYDYLIAEFNTNYTLVDLPNWYRDWAIFRSANNQLIQDNFELNFDNGNDYFFRFFGDNTVLGLFRKFTNFYSIIDSEENKKPINEQLGFDNLTYPYQIKVHSFFITTRNIDNYYGHYLPHYNNYLDFNIAVFNLYWVNIGVIPPYFLRNLVNDSDFLHPDLLLVKTFTGENNINYYLAKKINPSYTIENEQTVFENDYEITYIGTLNENNPSLNINYSKQFSTQLFNDSEPQNFFDTSIIYLSETELYNLMVDSQRIKEIHQALNADKYAWIDNNGTAEPATHSLGWKIEKIAQALGILFDLKGDIQSLRQSKKIESGSIVEDGYYLGQFGINEGGSTSPNSLNGGVEGEERLGLIYEIKSNQFTKDPASGNPALGTSGYVLVESIPQLLHVILQDLDKCLGLQELGAYIIKNPNYYQDSPENPYYTFEGLGDLIKEIAYTLTSVSQQATQANLGVLKTQASVNELFGALGLPTVEKTILLTTNQGNQQEIKFSAFNPESMSLADLHFIALQNLALINQATIELNYSEN